MNAYESVSRLVKRIGELCTRESLVHGEPNRMSREEVQHFLTELHLEAAQLERRLYARTRLGRAQRARHLATTDA